MIAKSTILVEETCKNLLVQSMLFYLKSMIIEFPTIKKNVRKEEREREKEKKGYIQHENPFDYIRHLSRTISYDSQSR